MGKKMILLMRIVTSVPCDSVNRQEFDIIDKIK